jgi:phosphatidylserine/phosphatidylglycerophosphate/cardiolipin synthase-like enzyme
MDTPVNVTYCGVGWAAALAHECSRARTSIILSALSMQPPTPKASGDWPQLWRAMCEAPKRGVRVRVLLPAPSPIYPATKGNFRAGSELTKEGVEINYIKGPKLLHAKTAIIDNRAVWIGSGNLTAAAAHHNHEAYIRLDSERIACDLLKRWEALL